MDMTGQKPGVEQAPAEVTEPRSVLPPLAEICQSPEKFLATLDIAALNLACAHGLPGANGIDAEAILARLDEAARQVGLETRRHWYRFNNSPANYKSSPAYFCCYFLLQVLQEDFIVKYNPARIRDQSFQDPKCFDPDFCDSRDLFIHGIVAGPGGTCASMPVLYVAVARRLGYPLKLVESRGHLFCRWDDPTGERFGIPEVFNIEGSGSGIGSFPDEYYRNWPERWTPADEVGGWYLKSLTPSEELAAFLCTRGECLKDNGRVEEAIQAYRWACGLSPSDLRYRSQLAKLVHRQYGNIIELQHLLETGRADRTQVRGPLPPGFTGYDPPKTSSPHDQFCQCLSCRDARKNPPGRGILGHSRGCQCSHCRQAKMNARIPNPFKPWQTIKNQP